MVGAVTALVLSHDHTFVVAGHANGHIQLFDLKKLHMPVRSAAPMTPNSHCVRQERRTPARLTHRQYWLCHWAAHHHCHCRPDRASYFEEDDI
jgi:hypothetical protein